MVSDDFLDVKIIMKRQKVSQPLFLLLAQVFRWYVPVRGKIVELSTRSRCVSIARAQDPRKRAPTSLVTKDSSNLLIYKCDQSRHEIQIVSVVKPRKVRLQRHKKYIHFLNTWTNTTHSDEGNENGYDYWNNCRYMQSSRSICLHEH